MDRARRLAPPLAVVGAAALGAILAPACKRSSPAAESSSDLAGRSGAVVRDAPLPTYRFRDEDLKRAYPDVTAFVTQFLETCLTGDYLAYRRLVSRYENPESRERFSAIYQGIESITVESIEPIDPARFARLSRGGPKAPGSEQPPGDAASTESTGEGSPTAQRTPAYRVVSSVTFSPQSKASLRHKSRSIAILVFEELGDWRMAPAPAELQPRDASRGESTDAEAAESQPSPDYPWEQDGDW